MLLLVLPGCFDGAGPSQQASEDEGVSVASGLQRVEDGRLVDHDALPGFIVTEGERWTLVWEPLEFLARDTQDVVLLQATADTAFNLVAEDAVYFRGAAEGNPEAPKTACGTVIYGDKAGPDRDEPVPGQYFLDRAMGIATESPPVPPTFGMAMGSIGGGAGASVPAGGEPGWGGSNGGYDGALAAGEWILISAGISGFTSEITTGDSVVRYTIAADAPFRVIDLPSAELFCGIGWSHLRNSTFQSNPMPGIQVGGDLEISALYGSHFYWNNICWPADGSPANAGNIAFDAEDHALNDADVAMSLYSYGDVRPRITVENWKGSPIWALVGLPVDEAPPNVMEFPACLR